MGTVREAFSGREDRSELERFALDVLDTLAIQDGTVEVFGRRLEMTDAAVVRLIRSHAERIGAEHV